MIEFVSEVMRTQFHLLPIETQKEWESMAKSLQKKGHRLVVDYIEQVTPSHLEVSIRVLQESKIDVTSDPNQLDLFSLS